MFDVLLDLLILIDIVIDGVDEIGFIKFVKFVSGEECFLYVEGVVFDNVVIVRLVVDILIVKMGGVEGLDEKKEMIVLCVLFCVGLVILGSKFFLWLFYEGDSEILMFFRIRMVRVLVFVL